VCGGGGGGGVEWGGGGGGGGGVGGVGGGWGGGGVGGGGSWGVGGGRGGGGVGVGGGGGGGGGGGFLGGGVGWGGRQRLRRQAGGSTIAKKTRAQKEECLRSSDYQKETGGGQQGRESDFKQLPNTNVGGEGSALGGKEHAMPRSDRGDARPEVCDEEKEGKKEGRSIKTKKEKATSISRNSLEKASPPRKTKHFLHLYDE